MKRLWLVLPLLLLVPGCASVARSLQAAGVLNPKEARALAAGGKVLETLRPFGWEEERAIGGAVALEAVARFGGMYPDARAQRYVGLVGHAVARTSDRPGIPYHFGVLADETPNAFACPGGYVFVTVGLLRMVQDESELAGILGHEIAHVSKKHALKAIRRAEVISSVGEVTASYLADNPEVFDAVVDNATSTIFDKGLDQSKEVQADRVGVDYAWRVGYDPAALGRFLDRLEAQHDEIASSRIFATHPPVERRKKAIARQLAEYQDAGGPRLARRYIESTRRLRTAQPKR